MKRKKDLLEIECGTSIVGDAGKGRSIARKRGSKTLVAREGMTTNSLIPLGLRALIISILASSILQAGALTYRFESKTTGAMPQELAGDVVIDANRSRITIVKGDGLLFEGGEVLLTSGTSPTITVLRPARKSYYEMNVDDLSALAARLTNGMRGFVDLQFSKPRVTSRLLASKPYEGRATRGYEVRTAVDVTMKVLGAPQKATINSVSNWTTTDTLPANAMTFLQRPGTGKGITVLDQLLAMESSAVKGFPLLQTRKVTTRIGKREQTTQTVTRVSNIRQVATTGSDFVRPPAFTKEVPPLARLRSSLGF